MSESALGRAIAQRALQLKENGKRPDSGNTSTAVRAAVIEAISQHRCDHYTRRPGIAPLCRAVATALAPVGIEVDPDEGVVISGGARETRFVALRTLGAAQRIFIPDGRPTPNAIAAQMPPPTFTAYLPIGDLLPESTIEGYAVSEPFASRPGLWIWHSAIPVTLEDVHPDATVIADGLDAAEVVPDGLRALMDAGLAKSQMLILGAFGKSAGLAAWNVAWFAGPNPLVAKVRTLKQAMTICTPAPGQYAALATMEGAGK